jgi:hypothetical protein
MPKELQSRVVIGTVPSYRSPHENEKNAPVILKLPIYISLLKVHRSFRRSFSTNPFYQLKRSSVRIEVVLYSYSRANR